MRKILLNDINDLKITRIANSGIHFRVKDKIYFVNISMEGGGIFLCEKTTKENKYITSSRWRWHYSYEGILRLKGNRRYTLGETYKDIDIDYFVYRLVRELDCFVGSAIKDIKIKADKDKLLIIKLHNINRLVEDLIGEYK